MSEKTQRRRSASHNSGSGGSRPVLKALSKDTRRFDSPKSSLAQKSNLAAVVAPLHPLSPVPAAAANRAHAQRSLAAVASPPSAAHSHVTALLQDAKKNALTYPSFSSLLSKKRGVSAAASASFDVVTQHRLLLLKNHPKVFTLHKTQEPQPLAQEQTHAHDPNDQKQQEQTTAAGAEDRSTSAGAHNMEREEDSETAQMEEGEEDEGREDTEEMQPVSDSEPEPDDEYPTIMWTGYGKKTPVLVFKSDAIVSKKSEFRVIGEKYHLQFKFQRTECKILRTILSAHGLSEAHPNSNDFNLMWTGTHLKPYVLRSLQEFQKVNHFPRSYEITRKDRLFKNIQRLQQTKGVKHFDFIPPSYIVPGEFQDFCAQFLKDKGPYIVKPIASSRGRGIFLVNHPEQVPLDDTLIVSKYIPNPLLIDGFKFNLRLYVAVTSYDPMVVYMYEEGMARFATVKYQSSNRSLRNHMMHLTNYSINKKNQDFVKNEDPDVEDHGNKWTLGALLRLLRQQGKDTTAMMMRIEDVIIKTLISAELPIATACKMFMPFRGNCFELYGFDILVDDNLRPWVLEVNLSPSLACDTPVDLKIKGNMLTDLCTLIGLVCHDPMTRKLPGRINPPDLISRPNSRQNRPGSAASARMGRSSTSVANGNGASLRNTGLTGEEIKIVRRAKEEFQRRQGWIRIFPSPDSWELYSSFMQYTTTHNLMLWQQLFPERAKAAMSLKPSTAAYSSTAARAKNVHLHSAQYPQLYISTQLNSETNSTFGKKALKKDDALAQALQRSLQYERRLTNIGDRRKSRRRRQGAAGKCTFNPKSSLAQGIEVTLEEGDGVSSKKPPVAQALLQRNNSRDAIDSATPSQSSVNSGRYDASSVRMTSSGTRLHHEQLQVGAGANGKASPSETSVEVKTSKSEMTCRSSAPDGQATRDHRSRQTKTQSTRTNGVASERRASFDVVRLLERGKIMTKVQARFAFSTYLLRVQQRLLLESDATDPDNEEQATEQMDLVMRFLKRAAGNLQQPIKVVVPSRKLPVNDRRRILAKQLGDFVQIYNKETEQLRQRTIIERKCLKRPEVRDALDEEQFAAFVAGACESELEEVLTTYTKLNRSASIFLGSNSNRTPSNADVSSKQTNVNLAPAGPAHPQSQTQAEAEQGSRRREPHPADNGSYLSSKAAAGGGDVATAEGLVPSQKSSAHSSYANAVSIYSSKLRQRPLSASSQHSNLSSRGSMRSRPTSAVVRRPNSAASIGPREKPDGAEIGSVAEEGGVVNSALQRFSVRQQQRQYTAPKGSNVLSSNDTTPRDLNLMKQAQLKHASQPPNEQLIQQQLHLAQVQQQLAQRQQPHNGDATATAVDLYAKDLTSSSQSNMYDVTLGQGRNHLGDIVTPQESFKKRLTSAASRGGVRQDSARTLSSSSVRSSARSLRSANDTFNNFVDDLYNENPLTHARQADPPLDAITAAAYSKVTGVTPINRNYTPTFHSTQYQIAQHQQLLKQQRMIEQSKAIIESSKARHQEMVAQAHQQRASAVDESLLPPKPPLNPNAESRKGGRRPTRAPPLGEEVNHHPANGEVASLNTNARPRITYSSAHNTGHSSLSRFHPQNKQPAFHLVFEKMFGRRAQRAKPTSQHAHVSSHHQQQQQSFSTQPATFFARAPQFPHRDKHG